MQIPKEIRAILACPKCRGELDDAPDGSALKCSRCRLTYPIRDGIPVLLLDHAKPTE